MKRLYSILLFVCTVLRLGAQELPAEYLYVQTDKNFYLSGEKLWLKISELDSELKSLSMSKIAYVELVGNAENMVQQMIVLNNGEGNGVLELPYHLSSGRYKLIAYTRAMRNGGEQAFFQKDIDVFNALRYAPALDQVEFSEGDVPTPVLGKGNLNIKSDKQVYGTRTPVNVRIEGIPSDSHVAVSVVRADGKPEFGASAFQLLPKQKNYKKTSFLPEYEGMIIEAKLQGENVSDISIQKASLSIPGKEIQYYAGKPTQGGATFYLPLNQGMSTVVTHTDAPGYLDLVSPFVANNKRNLQPVKIYMSQEKALNERSIALQTGTYYGLDSLQMQNLIIPTPYDLKPSYVYDMDEYKRFDSFELTFIEFVPTVAVRNLGGKDYIAVFNPKMGIKNSGNSLILVDGVPVSARELLDYNPRYAKFIEVYLGTFVFGEQVFEGILSVRTPNANLTSFKLDSHSHQCVYPGPQLPVVFSTPVINDQNIPDVRHTLYWNPSVTKGQEIQFKTSDLTGTYIVTVEGISPNGTVLQGQSLFVVE